jgi:hypothetical protein
MLSSALLICAGPLHWELRRTVSGPASRQHTLSICAPPWPRGSRNLKPEGWTAVTEIDDLFGHEPLSARTKALLGAYCDDALVTGRYDFRAGRKLKSCLERSGF